MTAGKGIVHSERTPAAELARTRKVFGIQAWVALPKKFEEVDPGFEHVRPQALPLVSDHGREVRVIAGSLFGETSPVKTHSDLFYGDVKLAAGARLPLPVEHEERAIYLAEGRIEIAGQSFEAGRLLVFKPRDAITVLALEDCRFMLLGGEPMDGPRHIWWNFVSSSKDRLDAAKEDWKQGRFEIVPGDEKEFIPLPA
jgi:redox-sensitive bicupin YhaK (pirin superfamily)